MDHEPVPIRCLLVKFQVWIWLSKEILYLKKTRHETTLDACYIATSPEVCPPEYGTIGYNTPPSSPCEKLLTSLGTGKAFLTTAHKPVSHTLTAQKTGSIWPIISKSGLVARSSAIWVSFSSWHESFWERFINITTVKKILSTGGLFSFLTVFIHIALGSWL